MFKTNLAGKGRRNRTARERKISIKKMMTSKLEVLTGKNYSENSDTRNCTCFLKF